MKLSKRILTQLFAELILGGQNKKDINNFLKNNNTSKDELLNYAKTDNYRGQRSGITDSDFARKMINKEIELIKSYDNSN